MPLFSWCHFLMQWHKMSWGEWEWGVISCWLGFDFFNRQTSLWTSWLWGRLFSYKTVTWLLQTQASWVDSVVPFFLRSFWVPFKGLVHWIMTYGKEQILCSKALTLLCKCHWFRGDVHHQQAWLLFLDITITLPKMSPWLMAPNLDEHQT